MKKRILTLIVLMITHAFIFAQNVGIGTTTPASLLHVHNGTVLFSGPNFLAGNLPIHQERERVPVLFGILTKQRLERVVFLTVAYLALQMQIPVTFTIGIGTALACSLLQPGSIQKQRVIFHLPWAQPVLQMV